MKNFTWLSRALPLLSLLFLITFWQLGATIYSPIIIPSPIETLQTLINLINSGKLWQHASETIYRGMVGFLISVLIGTPLGLVMGLNNMTRQLIQPLIVTLQVIPIISWLVLAMIWFGFEKVPVFIVVITTLPLVVINIVQGVQNVNPKLTEMAKFFKVTKRDLIVYLYIPQIVPYIFAAMSAALGTTWKAVAMAEFLSTQKGIGASMSVARINLETAEVFAWTILLVLLGLLSDFGLQSINKRLTKWRKVR
jgi:NitT/TauT family transport system permease protein